MIFELTSAVLLTSCSLLGMVDWDTSAILFTLSLYSSVNGPWSSNSIRICQAVMQASDTWQIFIRSFVRAFPPHLLPSSLFRKRVARVPNVLRIQASYFGTEGPSRRPRRAPVLVSGLHSRSLCTGAYRVCGTRIGLDGSTLRFGQPRNQLMMSKLSVR